MIPLCQMCEPIYDEIKLLLVKTFILFKCLLQMGNLCNAGSVRNSQAMVLQMIVIPMVHMVKKKLVQTKMLFATKM